MTLRLKDCWAPELRGEQSEAGVESRDALVDMLDPPCEVVVHIPTGEARSLSDVISFGRPVANIWRLGIDATLSDELINLGFATAEKES